MDKQQKKPLILLFLLLIILTYSGPLWSQDFYHSATSLGQAASLSADPYSILSRYNNPAGGSWNPNFGFSCDYQRRFELKELDSYSFMLFMPIRSFLTSLHGFHFGGELYSRQSLSVSISKIFFEHVSLGTKLGKEQINLKNYGNDTRDFFDIGILTRFNDFSLGLHTENLFYSDLTKFSRDNSFVWQLSAIFQPNGMVNLYADSRFYQNNNHNLSFGISSRLTQRLQVRMGYNTTFETIHFGIGINHKSFEFCSGFGHHPELGWSQAYGISVGNTGMQTE